MHVFHSFGKSNYSSRLGTKQVFEPFGHKSTNGIWNITFFTYLILLNFSSDYLHWVKIYNDNQCMHVHLTFRYLWNSRMLFSNVFFFNLRCVVIWMKMRHLMLWAQIEQQHTVWIVVSTIAAGVANTTQSSASA